MNNKERPVFISVSPFTFAFPFTALASIAHRITGVLLVAGIGYLLWLLQRTAMGTPSEEFAHDPEIVDVKTTEWISWVPLLVLIVVLGFLSSSLHAMASLSNRTWSFEQPAPFTYPVFLPEGAGLRADLHPVADLAVPEAGQPELRLRVGPSDLAGSLRLDRRGKPELIGELRSERLDLTTLLGAAASVAIDGSSALDLASATRASASRTFCSMPSHSRCSR